MHDRPWQANGVLQYLGWQLLLVYLFQQQYTATTSTAERGYEMASVSLRFLVILHWKKKADRESISVMMLVQCAALNLLFSLLMVETKKWWT